jgi:hypothetical protein
VRLTRAQTVTGEKYVQTYYDPLSQSRFFISNVETRCMLRGDCGVAGIRDELAQILTRGIGETWTTAQFTQWLTGMADGVTSPTNIELWLHADPFTWSAVGTGVSFSLTTSQTTFTAEPGTIMLTAADTIAVYQAIRSFLVSYVATHPEQYGGTITTGPSLAHDPSWRTSDPNEPGVSVTGAQYVARWLPPDHVWLSNKESRRLVAAYQHALATELDSMPSSPGVPALEAFLGHLIDGINSPSNEEFDPNADPLHIIKSTNTIEFYEQNTTGTAVIVERVTLPAANMNRIYASIVTPGLAAIVTTNPSDYGGSAATGPELAHNPTWSTQDPN